MSNPTLTPEQLNSLYYFSKINGRSWKQKLNFAWMDGDYGYGMAEHAGYLQQVRNQFGPSWLVKFSLK